MKVLLDYAARLQNLVYQITSDFAGIVISEKHLEGNVSTFHINDELIEYAQWGEFDFDKPSVPT
jgi:hypothetical protein